MTEEDKHDLKLDMSPRYELCMTIYTLGCRWQWDMAFSL